MSRHKVEMQNGHYAVVGYDAPMRTFFANVYSHEHKRLEAEAEARFNQLMKEGKQAEAEAVYDNVPKSLVFGIGNKYDQIQTVEALESKLIEAGWGGLNREVKQQLQQDKQQESELFQPSSLQQFAEALAQQVEQSISFRD